MKAKIYLFPCKAWDLLKIEQATGLTACPLMENGREVIRLLTMREALNVNMGRYYYNVMWLKNLLGE